MPLVSTFDGDILRCDLPCQINQFLYPNNTCQPACNNPLTKITQGDLKMCDSHCSSSDFLYGNGSCLSTCPNAFQQDLGSSKTLCQKHCPPNEGFVYWNHSCLSYCGPLFDQSVDSVTTERHCNWPCSDSSEVILYENGTCSETCQSPFITQSVTSGYYLCNSPCGIDKYYSLDSKKCVSSCQSPSITGQIGTLKICKQVITQEEPERETSKVVNAITEVAAKAGLGLALVNALLRPGNAGSLSLIALSKLLRYLEYIEIAYPAQVEDLFELDLFEIAIDFGTGSTATLFKDRLTDYPSLAVFQKRGTESNFIVNYWNSISLMLIASGAALLIIPVEKITKRYKSFKVASIIAKVKGFLRWNFLLFIFIESFDDLALFIYIQLKTFKVQSFLDIFTLLVSLITLVLAVFMEYKIVRIAREFTKPTVYPEVSVLSNNGSPTNHIEILHEKYKKCIIFFKEYKHKSFMTQAFVFFFSLRIAVYYLIVGVLHEYPLCQGFLLTIIGCMMLFYIVKLKPIDDNFALIENFVFEILILMANLCIIILAIMEKQGDHNYETWNRVGDALVICNLAACLATFIFSVVALVIAVKEWYQHRKAAAKAKKAIKPDIEASNETGLQIDLSKTGISSRSSLRISTFKKENSKKSLYHEALQKSYLLRSPSAILDKNESLNLKKDDITVSLWPFESDAESKSVKRQESHVDLNISSKLLSIPEQMDSRHQIPQKSHFSAQTSDLLLVSPSSESMSNFPSPDEKVKKSRSLALKKSRIQRRFFQVLSPKSDAESLNYLSDAPIIESYNTIKNVDAGKGYVDSGVDSLFTIKSDRNREDEIGNKRLIKNSLVVPELQETWKKREYTGSSMKSFRDQRSTRMLLKDGTILLDSGRTSPKNTINPEETPRFEDEHPHIMNNE